MKLRKNDDKRPSSAKEEGVALVFVVVMLAMLATTVADFAYQARVDFSEATNARDDLRAHYLARSSINLSRMLLRVQQKLIDPNQKMMGGMDLQVTDFAPLIVSAFNSAENAQAFGSFLGLQGDDLKGFGVDVGGFDLEIESLDGKLNLNCGGGTNAGDPQVLRFASALSSMVAPERYNRLFESADDQGDFVTRTQLVQAIIDWADQDTVTFGTATPEDYRYNARKQPYEIKNQSYDTVEELRLVKGVSEDVMASFGEMFTVYGGCKVNVNLSELPVVLGLIVQYAANKTDPGLQYQNLMLLARYVVQIRDLVGGFTDANAFIKAVEDPMGQLSAALLLDSTLGGESATQGALPHVTGLKLDGKVNEAIVAGGPRRISRIKAMATVGRIRKTITAVWDNQYVSTQASQHGSGSGAFMYWREE